MGSLPHLRNVLETGGEGRVVSEVSRSLTKETTMALTMKEKQAVTKQLALEYKRAGKKKKEKILDSVLQLTDYNRSYAASQGTGMGLCRT